MACPETARRALEGLPGIQSIDMRLEHDAFVVSYDASQVSVEHMKKAVTESGFPAREVALESVRPVATRDTRSNTDWPEFYEQALLRAQRENLDVLLYFHADWCAPCVRLARETFTDETVRHALERMVWVKVNVDEYPQLAESFDVSGIPEFRLLSSAGEEHGRLSGFHPPESFLVTLNEWNQRGDADETETNEE